ncbi:MAG TPA: D-alanyl-D-alanine carboxypeptidase family protein [Baekduia sp.]|uniref:D-alanyl-D-alanine carboxypeptidase family protein n=1 Tax=Baekduia sp. TaxID=2600305 RepID=UPI002D79D6E3|nr:D-alanyl-D-alanine carboxypeptidase family protein [Baekduia sp.]HET6507696.1 D-alanyl-D-alanine carboxypeptidase family protein [Baekduia sp.]
MTQRSPASTRRATRTGLSVVLALVVLLLHALPAAHAAVAPAAPETAPAAPAATDSADAPKLPSIRAPEAILVEPATGDVVYQRNADKRALIASTTKLMTALVTLEHASLDDVMTTIDYHASPAESLAGFGRGERVTVRDLLRALLITSANDAAATLAQRVGGTRAKFVEMMNERAKQLGLDGTHYDNPIGLDGSSNYSTAADLAKLTLILRRNAFFRETTDLRSVTLKSGDHPRTFANRNLLVRSWGPANGVKTGHTNSAGYILVGSASRAGITVISVVLGDPSENARDDDSLALLKYGLARYHVVTAVRRGQVVAHAALSHRDDRVALTAADTVKRTTRRGDQLVVTVTGAPTTIDGPLPKGARVGTVNVVQRGKVVARVPLVTADAVDAASFFDRLRDWLDSPVTLVLLAAFAVCSLYLVLLRRRAVRRRQRRRAGRGAPVA